MIRYIHGSADSLDVDVFYVFDELPDRQICQKFCSDKFENRNIITIKDGLVTACYKGTVDEDNNALYYTYGLHKQEYPLLITKLYPRDILIKSIRVLRCLVSHCSRTEYRNEVKTALNAGWVERLGFLKSVDFKNIKDFGKSGTIEDIYKIFAFQVGQAVGLLDGIELYTKSAVAIQYPRLKPYLYRVKDTDIENLLKYIKMFISAIDHYSVEQKGQISYFKDFDKTIDLKSEKYI